MIVENLESIEVKYFKVKEKDIENSSLTETDCFNYYKELGYRVYSDYAFYFRKNSNKQVNSHNQFVSRNELRKLKPEFDIKIKELFKKYSSGEPDLLVEKNGIWEFIEVKTTNDSLKPHQLLFIEKLSKIAKVSIHYFIDVEGLVIVPKSKSKKNEPRKDRGKIEVKFDDEYFENELIILSNIAKKRKYSKYFPVAQIYKQCPEYPYSPVKLALIEKYSGVSIQNIKWYLNKNCKQVSTDAIRKITKKNQLTGTDKELLLKHKDIIARMG